MEPTVWTSRRKALGNLFPAIVWLIPAAAGLWMMVGSNQLLGPGLWMLVGSTVLGWVALDSFGLFENAKMRRMLQEILTQRGEPPLAASPFVGFSTPKYHGLLDAHEDVGFLEIHPDKLVFIGENRRVEFLHTEVKSVQYRFNVHSLLLLGRWVSVEGESGGKPIRMLVESRDRPTMLGNFRESSLLHARLLRWSKPKRT